MFSVFYIEMKFAKHDHSPIHKASCTRARSAQAGTKSMSARPTGTLSESCQLRGRKQLGLFWLALEEVLNIKSVIVAILILSDMHFFYVQNFVRLFNVLSRLRRRYASYGCHGSDDGTAKM